MKTIKIDECMRRIRSYAMQFEAEGKKNISEDLWVAVEFLKQQTTMCFDCSRREWYQRGYQDGLNADKWIPCSERLPKIGQCVLIQLDMNEYDSEYDSTIQVRRYDGEQDVYKWKWEGLDIWTSEDVVLAWQPLPQPYKKEGAE